MNIPNNPQKIPYIKPPLALQIPNKRPASLVNSFNHQAPSERKLYNTLVLLVYLMNLISQNSL